MKKILLLGASALLISTAANAANPGGPLQDGDGSADTMSWSANTPDDYFEDANSTISANFTMHGNVTKTCSIQGVDDGSPGLNGSIDLGTIGIQAGDDQSVDSLFTMTGPATVNIHSAAAGCNYNNTVTLAKDSANGLVNTAPGNYDSSQFQANIPYEVAASFTGVQSGVGAGSGQTVDVGVAQASNSGNFGAWRSPLDLNVTIPQVTGKGLVGGDYQGTVTITLAIS